MNVTGGVLVIFGVRVGFAYDRFGHAAGGGVGFALRSQHTANILKQVAVRVLDFFMVHLGRFPPLAGRFAIINVLEFFVNAV